MASEAAGPAFLSILLALAVAVAVARRQFPLDSERVLPAAAIALALQAVHVAEEFATGFHRALPGLLGLVAWSPGFFVAFNLGWIALWSMSLAAVAGGRTPVAAAASLWFLAIAAVGNAVWHPLLLLATGGYFPGSASALPLGAAGWLLARRLGAPRRP